MLVIFTDLYLSSKEVLMCNKLDYHIAYMVFLKELQDMSK